MPNEKIIELLNNIKNSDNLSETDLKNLSDFEELLLTDSYEVDKIKYSYKGDDIDELHQIIHGITFTDYINDQYKRNGDNAKFM